jgi:predicted ATPase
MILGRFFSKLFDLDITVIITSNRHPKDLYQGKGMASFPYRHQSASLIGLAY